MSNRERTLEEFIAYARDNKLEHLLKAVDLIFDAIEEAKSPTNLVGKITCYAEKEELK